MISEVRIGPAKMGLKEEAVMDRDNVRKRGILLFPGDRGRSGKEGRNVLHVGGEGSR